MKKKQSGKYAVQTWNTYISSSLIIRNETNERTYQRTKCSQHILVRLARFIQPVLFSVCFWFGLSVIPFWCFFSNSEAMQMHKHKHKYFDWFRVHGTNSNQRLCENFCIKFTYLFVRHYDDSLAFDTDNEKPIVCQLHSMNGQAIIPES